MAAGALVAENTPPTARIGLVAAAVAARATAARTAVDLPVLTEGSQQLLRDYGIDFVIAETESAVSRWGRAREVERLSSGAIGSTHARALALYRLDWQMPEGDRAQPLAIRLDGYSVLDAVDIGDPGSETRHFYAATTQGLRTRGEGRLRVGWITDDGRSQETGRGGESFTLGARPGRDLVLAVRYDAATRGLLRVEVEREPIDWRLRDCAASLCEDAIVIPGGLVKGPSLRVTVTFGTLPGAPPGRVATYHYWAFARD